MEYLLNTIIQRKNAVEAGLTGGFFRLPGHSNSIFGLSCNHVIANLNKCRVGDIICDSQNKSVGILSHWLILMPSVFNASEFALYQLDFSPPPQLLWPGGVRPSGFVELKKECLFIFLNRQVRQMVLLLTPKQG